MGHTINTNIGSVSMCFMRRGVGGIEKQFQPIKHGEAHFG